jgi:DMSO/TMAO reductase YedYZ heme-binding membrane subunit
MGASSEFVGSGGADARMIASRALPSAPGPAPPRRNPMAAPAKPPSAAAAARTRTILACCLAAALVAGTAVAVGLSLGGDPKEAWQLAARYTARVGFLFFFMPVFAASAWHRLAPSPLSRWVMVRRRALGLAFATSHTIHLIALTTFNVIAGSVPDAVTLGVGGGAYVAMFAMAATSSDAAVRRLGAQRWQRLHRVGIYWLWFVFTFSYAGRVAEGRLAFLPFLGLALGAYGLRIAAWRARRARRAPAGAAAAG